MIPVGAGAAGVAAFAGAQQAHLHPLLPAHRRAGAGENYQPVDSGDAAGAAASGVAVSGQLSAIS